MKKIWLCGTGLSLVFASKIPVAIAQPAITADGTTNTNVSVIMGMPPPMVPPGSTIINQGTLVGDNLFHSFDAFNINPGQNVFFNAQGAARIINRVTGSGATIINGRLGVLNNATSDIYFLNPNGLSFGSEANLTLQGSFFGSTATALTFQDGTVFSTADPSTPPLLTVSTPSGLQFGQTPAAIALNGSSINLAADQSFNLFGGALLFNGSDITIKDGKLLFVSLAEAGEISLLDNIQDFMKNLTETGIERGNIEFQNASIDLQGKGGGGFGVAGKNFTLENSTVIAGIKPMQGSSGVSAGDVTINLTGKMRVVDNSIFNNSLSVGGTGRGGDISITAKRFFLQDSQMNVNTLGNGGGGNFQITASEKIELVSTRALTPMTTSFTGISASTLDSATGAGGTIFFSAPDIVLDGSLAISGITASTQAGGKVIFLGDRLTMSNGAVVESAVASSGNGDFVNIGTLDSFDTAQELNNFLKIFEVDTAAVKPFTSVSLESGAAINVSVQSGATGNGGEARVNTASLTVDNALINASAPGSGKAGDLILNSTETIVRNNGKIFVDSTNQGAAGKLRIIGDRLFLDRGFLSSNTVADPIVPDSTADIFLDIDEFIFLDNGSLISTNATGSASGGDIAIDTEFLIARNNSDITANSQNAFGGRVFVTATGIYGTEFRDFLTADSDITASSRLGAEFSGLVVLSTPEVDPTSSLTKLPENLVDGNDQISQQCDTSKRNQFVLVGRGGVPPTPSSVADTVLWSDLRNPAIAAPSSSTRSSQPSSETIVQAQQWQRTPQGDIQLIAAQPSFLAPAPFSSCNSL